MAAEIGIHFQVQQTTLAAMRCGSITPETAKAFHALPSPVCRTINAALADLVADNNLNPKNLTTVAKLFTAAVDLAVRRVG